MSKRKLLVANWKMNLPPEGVEHYCARLNDLEEIERLALVIAPPFPFIHEVRSSVRGSVAVGSQNCSDRDDGAFTGEVSAAMLREAGAAWVIVGHSERRSLHGETNSLIAMKARAAISAELTPVVCVGESSEVRNAGHPEDFICGQLRESLKGFEAGSLVVAYEPVWAIGTGRHATPEIVSAAHQALRQQLTELNLADALLLYGGSVSPENSAELAAIDAVDGFLVGGASLDSSRFLSIRQAFAG